MFLSDDPYPIQNVSPAEVERLVNKTYGIGQLLDIAFQDCAHPASFDINGEYYEAHEEAVLEIWMPIAALTREQALQDLRTEVRWTMDATIQGLKRKGEGDSEEATWVVHLLDLLNDDMCDVQMDLGFPIVAPPNTTVGDIDSIAPQDNVPPPSS